MKRKKEFFGVLISVLLCVFLVVLAVYATTTISEDITIGNGGGMRIGTGSNADNFTALDDDSLFIEGILEVDGAAWFDSVVSVSGDFEVGSDKFTVAGSSGNTVVVGTLGVTGLASFVNASVSGDFEVTDIFGYDYSTEHNLWAGYLAGQDLAVGGQYNTLIGEQAGTDITTGDYNTVFGYQAGFTETTALNSTFIGYQAGYALEGTSNNVAVGWKAMYGVAPTGYGGNTAIGTEAFYAAGEESLRNTVVGYQALFTASDEAENITAIGYRAGYSLTSPASNNVLVGSYAGLGANQAYENNVAIGFEAMTAATTGGYNTIMGSGTAKTQTTAENNVVIGAKAGEDITTGSNNVVIGYMAGEGWLTTDSNLLVIANTDTATPLIYGEFDAADSILNINGALTVGASATVSYSRFGAGTTDYGTVVSASSDLLISDNLEVDGTAIFDGTVSVSESNGILIGGGAKIFGGTASPQGSASNPSCTAGSIYIHASPTDEDDVIAVCETANSWQWADL